MRFRAYGIEQQPSSVRQASTSSLNDFFSRTNGPISIKLGRKHAWGMEIQMYTNKGACPFGGPIRGKIRNILINIQFCSHEPLTGMHDIWY